MAPMSEYGAVNTTEPSDVDVSFEEYNVNFLKDRPMSREERLKKVLTGAVPIVIALLLVLGFGLWATNAIGPKQSPHSYSPIHPYPAPTEDYTEKQEDSSTSKSTTTTTKSTQATDEDTHSSWSPSTSAAECSANKGCAKLDLAGECCPTAAGTMLRCCS